MANFLEQNAKKLFFKLRLMSYIRFKRSNSVDHERRYGREWGEFVCTVCLRLFFYLCRSVEFFLNGGVDPKTIAP